MLNPEQTRKILKKASVVLYVDACNKPKFPNLALMKLSNFLGIDYDFASASTIKGLPSNKLFRNYDAILVSCVFQYDYQRIYQYIVNNGWDNKTIISGHGSPYRYCLSDIIDDKPDIYDYSLYPWFEPNIGFSQRGCRLECLFCYVPKYEGGNHSVNSIRNLMQKKTNRLVLVDNDFFGQREWKEKCDYILGNKVKVSFTQGINLRLLTEEQAEYLVAISPWSYTFNIRLLNTAWDRLGDEKLFVKKLKMLISKGYDPRHIMVYMLIGFEKNESFEDIWYRFWILQKFGVMPYPMVYTICMDCPDQYSCTDVGCDKLQKVKALKIFRDWVQIYAKDRFVKHNTGDVEEKDYYKDFIEYFKASSKNMPKGIREFFTHSKFRKVKINTNTSRRIKIEDKNNMVSLWRGI